MASSMMYASPAHQVMQSPAPYTTYATPAHVTNAAPMQHMAAAPVQHMAAPHAVMGGSHSVMGSAPHVHHTTAPVGHYAAPSVSHISQDRYGVHAPTVNHAQAVIHSQPQPVAHAEYINIHSQPQPVMHAVPAPMTQPATIIQSPVYQQNVAVSPAPAHYVVPQTYLPAGLVLHPSTKAAYQQLQARLPWQRERLAERQHLFAMCDIRNSNGYLSFSEVEANLNAQLQLEQILPDSKMVLMKCFNEAKHWGGQQGLGADYVEKREFRIFLELLHKELDRLIGPDTDPHH